MSEQQKRETILSETKLRLYAQPLPGSDKKPVLIPEVFENNPRLRVRTNLQTDITNKGYIEAAMSSKEFYKLTAGIRALARDELVDAQGNKLNGFLIENYGHPFIQGQRSKEKRIVSLTKIERGQDGVIRISITAGKSRPIIEFVFLEDDYHYFKDLNGNPMNERLSSSLAAIAWCNMLDKFFAVALKDYVVPAWQLKRQQQQQQGGGNWNGGGQQGGGNWNRNNQGGGQQGGYSNTPSQAASAMDSFDLDIPL